MRARRAAQQRAGAPAPRRRGRRRREGGASLVEFAFVLPLLLLLVFGMFEFGRVFYIQLTLQSAVREASRLTITGETLADGQGGTLSRTESIIQRVNDSAPGLGLQPGNITISGPGGAGDAGGPGDLVTIRIDYDIDLLTPLVAAVFPNGQHHFTIIMISRNEPFPEG